MQLDAMLHSKSMRVTIQTGGKSIWASIHEAGERPHTRSLAVALSYDKPAELAAWQALSDALAAQDATAEAEAV